jgi:hypothetical protein
MAKGRRQNQKGRSETGTRFIQLEYWLLEHPNFLALSPNAKVCLLAIAKRYNGANNGRIAFGVRSGIFVPINGKELVEKPFGLSRFQIGRALGELEEAGLIVCTQGASFDQKRLMREWRLTWLPSGAKNEHRATKEFASFNPAEKQNPGALVHIPPTLQERQCSYEMEPISPYDLYRCTSAPIANSHRSTSAHHLVTMGCGGMVIPMQRMKTA